MSPRLLVESLAQIASGERRPPVRSPAARPKILLVSLVLVGTCAIALAKGDDHRNGNILPPPGTPIISASTTSTGDSNPYGVAFVPEGFPTDGSLAPGDIVVSNFNGPSGFQGTGSSIFRITQAGAVTVFFQAPPPPPPALGLGFSTALGVLKKGFVIAGAVPTTDGTCATVSAGELLILDRHGNVVETLTDNTLLDGPWDLTIRDEGDRAHVFVSNVLSGTVTRLDLMIPSGGNPVVESKTQIASGYKTDCSAAAVVVGPTGLALDHDGDSLYVASTDDNAIFVVRNAVHRKNDGGKGRLVYQDDTHLHGPLALAFAPNGHLLTANGDAVNEDDSHVSYYVEFSKNGQFVAWFQIDPVIGSAFGLAVKTVDDHVLFAAVDDNTSMLEEWSEDR
jgi:DNA-binding beta-propeller fold protein YncE